MKPILVILKGDMSAEDIKRLNENGICTVEAENPALVRFLDPIPSAAERTQVEDAAIRLSKKVLAPGTWQSETTRDNVCRMYVDLLIRGTRLDPNPSEAEIEQKIFDEAKRAELQRLAREEAKAERLAAKQADKLKKKGGQ